MQMVQAPVWAQAQDSLVKWQRAALPALMLVKAFVKYQRAAIQIGKLALMQPVERVQWVQNAHLLHQMQMVQAPAWA
jgi:hypothetical protein